MRLQSLWSLREETRKTLREMLKCRAADGGCWVPGPHPTFSAHMLAVIPDTGLPPSSCPVWGWKTECL